MTGKSLMERAQALKEELVAVRRDALATMCIGMGQGIATVFERN